MKKIQFLRLWMGLMLLISHVEAKYVDSLVENHDGFGYQFFIRNQDEKIIYKDFFEFQPCLYKEWIDENRFLITFHISRGQVVFFLRKKGESFTCIPILAPKGYVLRHFLGIKKMDGKKYIRFDATNERRKVKICNLDISEI